MGGEGEGALTKTARVWCVLPLLRAGLVFSPHRSVTGRAQQCSMVDISPNIVLKFSDTHFNIIIPVYTLNNNSSLLFHVLIASASGRKTVLEGRMLSLK